MANKKQPKEFEKPKCDRCGGSFGHVQIKTNTWKCRRCNYVSPIPKEENK